MKKVMLYAYIDENIGDDLFLELICSRYKEEIDFYLYVPERLMDSYCTITNLHCIPYKDKNKWEDRINRYLFKGKLSPILKWNKMYLLDKKWVKKMDCQLWLGGSQFVETSDWKSVIKYKQHQQKITPIPFFSISATVGPFKTKAYINAVKQVIKGYTHITYRDKFSYDFMKGIGNSSYAFDMVFTKQRVGLKQSKKICISVIDTTSRFPKSVSEHYENYIVSLID